MLRNPNNPSRRTVKPQCRTPTKRNRYHPRTVPPTASSHRPDTIPTDHDCRSYPDYQPQTRAKTTPERHQIRHRQGQARTNHETKNHQTNHQKRCRHHPPRRFPRLTLDHQLPGAIQLGRATVRTHIPTMDSARQQTTMAQPPARRTRPSELQLPLSQLLHSQKQQTHRTTANSGRHQPLNHPLQNVAIIKRTTTPQSHMEPKTTRTHHRAKHQSKDHIKPEQNMVRRNATQQLHYRKIPQPYNDTINTNHHRQ